MGELAQATAIGAAGTEHAVAKQMAAHTAMSQGPRTATPYSPLTP